MTTAILPPFTDSTAKKTVRFRLPQPRHGRLQAQARQRVQDLQESLKKRLSKSISVGGCSSTNSPKRLD